MKINWALKIGAHAILIDIGNSQDNFCRRICFLSFAKTKHSILHDSTVTATKSDDSWKSRKTGEHEKKQ